MIGAENISENDKVICFIDSSKMPEYTGKETYVFGRGIIREIFYSENKIIGVNVEITETSVSSMLPKEIFKRFMITSKYEYVNLVDNNEDFKAWIQQYTLKRIMETIEFIDDIIKKSDIAI